VAGADDEGWTLRRDRRVRYDRERRLATYERGDGTTLRQYREGDLPAGVDCRGPSPEAGFAALRDRDDLRAFPGLDGVESLVRAVDGDVSWFANRRHAEGPSRGVRVETGAPGVRATVGLDAAGRVEAVRYDVAGGAGAADATDGLRRVVHDRRVDRADALALPAPVVDRLDDDRTVRAPVRERSVAHVRPAGRREDDPTARVVVGPVPPAEERDYEVRDSTVVVQPSGDYLRGVPGDVTPVLVDPAGAGRDAVADAVEEALGRQRLVEAIDPPAPASPDAPAVDRD
jgi:hypothetical protein